MDKNHSELFGHLAYAESLTYEALLSAEDRLTAGLEDLLQRAGAEHLDFTPLGDALMFSCAFEEHRLYVYRKIALDIAAMLPPGVSCRLLGLNKDFSALHVFWITPGQCQEENRSIPEQAPAGLKVWRAGCRDGGTATG